MKCYETAAVGTDEPAGMTYYNDQPADMIMYQGLAKFKLGRSAEAKSGFYRLIDYGEQHLWDDVKIEVEMNEQYNGLHFCLFFGKILKVLIFG